MREIMTTSLRLDLVGHIVLTTIGQFQVLIKLLEVDKQFIKLSLNQNAHSVLTQARRAV